MSLAMALLLRALVAEESETLKDTVSPWTLSFFLVFLPSLRRATRASVSDSSSLSSFDTGGVDA